MLGLRRFSFTLQGMIGESHSRAASPRDVVPVQETSHFTSSIDHTMDEARRRLERDELPIFTVEEEADITISLDELLSASTPSEIPAAASDQRTRCRGG